MRKLRVAVIFGGRSGEHEVSLASAESIMANLDRSKYEVVPIGISRQGKWLASGEPMATLKAGGEIRDSTSTVLVPGGSPGRLVRLGTQAENVDPGPLDIDVVFPVLHGPYGEDGTIQGLLEMADIPYVGAGVLASAVGMDKVMMKTVWRQHGLPVVDWLVALRFEWERDPDGVVSQIERQIEYPCFIKPANMGSSVGVSKARWRAELKAALAEAAQYDGKLMVEQAVNARELECSVLGNQYPRASVVGEIVPVHEFYDYRAKYVDEGSQLIIPADIPKESAERVRELAVRAFRAIDCAGMARVDFFLERESGRVLVNEINTIPGFTRISMYPKLWEASGLPYRELLDELIQLAVERHAEKSRNRVDYQP